MTLSGQNFSIFQGDNHEIIVSVKNQDGSPADLTGYSAAWCAYGQTSAETILLKTSSPGEGITIPNPADGKVIISLEQLDTQNLVTKNYGHQCEVEDSLGHHATVCTGYMKVLRSITHHSL